MRSGIAVVALLAAGCAAHRQTAVMTPAASQYVQDRQIVNAVDAGDGDYDLKLLRAQLDADPLNLKARLELAAHYRKLGFPEIATEHCRLACERAPDSDEAHVALAKMLRDSGKPAEGAKVLAAFAAKHERAGVTVWAWLGLLSDETENWEAGEAAYRKAIALAPDRDDLHNNLGYCLLKEDRKKEAAEELRAALRINPRSVIATNNLAAALDEASPKEAVERLQSVTDPATAHSNMAAVLIDAGRYPEARKEIGIALSYNRQHSAALANLALVSQKDGQPAQVRAVTETGRGPWARAVRFWHRVWGGQESSNGNITGPGTTTASR
jgi:tetratricopeptide (TPR) repeat protein